MKTKLNQLHDRDFNLWIEEVKTAIQNKDAEAMDWDNLLDEIDDMGKSEKRSLESYLELLVAHILKLKYWQTERERNYKHWQVEVVNFRKRIQRLLKRSPSLKTYMEEVYPEIYQDVVDAWQIEFDIPKKTSIALEKILAKDYFG
ncbi:DUF29 domain-containing protein [Pleurocapsa sp. FMAR1]|uniref:DUF29 domain-containing protein n=1 Tax=Pleurocapsa sp. FMAR1 TaxID=3040204 RepID=UPI0029C77FF2|nr:DUF29 domain-containing protein [Pleurocapsa sp. FMAR1]